MSVPSCRLIGLILSVSSFVPATAQAQYLSDRLVPPQHVDMPILRTSTQPVPPRALNADHVKSHMWSLPAGTIPGTPVAISLERLPADWLRPSLDVPVLPSARVPEFPQQPTSPRAYITSRNPQQSPPLDRFAPATDPPVQLIDNPSAEMAHFLLTLAVPLASPNPAPFLRLSIPNPFEQLKVIRLADPPADTDAPDASQERPPLRKLLEAPVR